MPGFEVFGEKEKQEIMDVLETGVLFRYEFGEQRKGVYKVRTFEEKFADYNGTDSFSYEVTDGQGEKSTASVNITVTPVNDDPEEESTSISTNQNCQEPPGGVVRQL